MGDKTNANQNGAQQQGVAVSGKTGNFNNGVIDSRKLGTEVGAVGGNFAITNNGISGEQISSLLGQFTAAPSSSQVTAATPPAVTPAPVTASATATDDAAARKKKLLTYGIAVVALLLGGFLFFRSKK